MDHDDLYRILDVSRSATFDQIKSAYRKKALQHHPDKGGDAEIFKQVSRAYQILSDPKLRSQYDQSLPIPESCLRSPLHVFAESFNQWFEQSPLACSFLKDSCRNVIQLLEMYHKNPAVQAIIESLMGGSPCEPPTPTPTSTPTSTPTPATAVGAVAHRKLESSFDDLYGGHRYLYQTTLVPEELGLASQVVIHNNHLELKIPLDQDEVEIETTLQLTDPVEHRSWSQKATILLEIVVHGEPHLWRLRETDLLFHVNVTLEELSHQEVMCVRYLGRKNLRFKNPMNYNLQQVYQIEGIALPDQSRKKRGDLYLIFHLVMCAGQVSSLIEDSGDGFLYTLTPINPSRIYQIECMAEPTRLPTYTVEDHRLVIVNQ